MTPEQWRDRLAARLIDRQRGLARLQAYYDGDHPLPQGPKKVTEKFRRLQREARTNWMALVVDAVAERLQVVGFRFGEETGGDDVAWRIWQTNHLDADHKLVHADALTLGCSYVLVWPDATHPAGVRITAEHASQCIVDYVPGDRRERAAGLKLWRDRDGFVYATVYLPGEVWRWVSDRPTTGLVESIQWQARSIDGEQWPAPTGLDAVPLVELRPRPRWDGTGRSELDGLTDIQDRINTTIFGRLVAAEFSAFRQRWATGMDIPEDDDGNPREPFEAAVDRLWVSTDPDTKFGEFSETDLANYVRAVEADVTHLAAISKTPPHYLLGALVNASGDALKSAETGLVSKAKDRQAFLGEDWEQVMRLALAAIGDPRAEDYQSEVIWRDPENRSEGELVDALTKMRGLGVPLEVLWQRWGASPQEISRWKAMAAEDALLAAIATQPAAVTASATAPDAAMTGTAAGGV